MLSVEQFVKVCAEHIKRREYFLAYWHPHGFGLLRTDTVEWEQYQIKIGGHFRNPDAVQIANTPEQRDAIVDEARRRGLVVLDVKVTKRTQKAKKGTISKMRKVIAQLRNDRRCQPLYVVEYDDIGLVTDGGEEVYALQSIPVSGGGDPVDA